MGIDWTPLPSPHLQICNWCNILTKKSKLLDYISSLKKCILLAVSRLHPILSIQRNFFWQTLHYPQETNPPIYYYCTLVLLVTHLLEVEISAIIVKKQFNMSKGAWQNIWIYKPCLRVWILFRSRRSFVALNKDVAAGIILTTNSAFPISLTASITKEHQVR